MLLNCDRNVRLETVLLKTKKNSHFHRKILFMQRNEFINLGKSSQEKNEGNEDPLNIRNDYTEGNPLTLQSKTFQNQTILIPPRLSELN